ncbi:TPA: hypothetical protein QCX88_004808 [Bacillus wiedmannii]|nr:hypothetical protein [Bacillus wiedmannii]
MDSQMMQKIKDLSTDFDKVFKTFENSYTDTEKSNWIIALIISIKDPSLYRNLKVIIAGIVSIVSSVASSYFFLSPEDSKVWIYGLAIGLWLIMAYFIQYKKMIDINNAKYFHCGAYRFSRKPEYDLFYKQVHNSFSFKVLYDSITSSGPAYDELKGKLEQIHIKQADVQELQSKYEQELENVKNLKQELDDVIYQVNFTSQLIKDIITILYQMNNDCFKESSLQLVCGFTIYELSEDKKSLNKIIDEGTTGAAKKTYEVPDEISQEHYAAIRVMNPNKEDRYAPEFDHPYNDHVIISLKMNMNEGKTWVFNFHAETTEDKHIFLLLSDNLISTRETFRLTHALCLNLQRKRGDIDVLENRSATENRSAEKGYTHV